MKKPIIFAAALLFAFAASQTAVAEPLATEQALADRIMGDPEAPITIIEYASLTCPHCAKFHKDSMPKLKAEWIDTGKARLIYRDFPTSPAGPSFAASMIARCAPADRYFGFIGAFYKGQKTWKSAPDPVAAVAQIARLYGMSRADVDACLQNEDLLDGINQMALDAKMEYGIESTPSFVIGDQIIRGNLPYDDFRDVLEQAAK